MKIFCSYCGAANSHPTGICADCGTPLPATPRQPAVGAAWPSGYEAGGAIGPLAVGPWPGGAPMSAAPQFAGPDYQAMPPFSMPAPYSAPFRGAQRTVYPAGHHLPALAPWQAAAFWPRVGAYLVDKVVIGAPMLAALLAVGAADSSSLAMVWLLGMLLWPAVYLIGCWTTSGRTLGYRAAGLQLVCTDGTRPGLGTGIVRYIGIHISAWVFFLGFFWMLWDENKQTWHDKMARTAVVRA